MQSNTDEKQRIMEARRKVRRLKLFYIHLAGYIVVVALLSYNLYIVEGPYKNNIISLNLSILVAWSVFIIIHGLNVFKEKQLFKKSWEERKLREFAKEDTEKQLWE